ncbi:MAG: competence/damage-inducible protein A [Chloroflexi bacterium HGW-Chloroflexi-5]|jgi:competence/damage-inducible protein CinA-like protein|nr:MAG: competence/damage-inducible protein A [Chloroflexi bacterium HGW-Chloroflexi-5]
MPTAELIAIGTELLLGEIVDTNTKYLARQLRDYGVDLYRSTTVGDNLQRITSLMQEALNRADIVITTGGLGPTVDDPTREAAAQACNTHNEFHPELWEQIRQRFLKRAMNISDNNRKQAMIPAGAVVIENPVGTAPSFIMPHNGSVLVCLPGVPREMEYLMQASVIPWLKDHYAMSGIIKAKVLHIAAVSESKIDEMIADLEEMTNPTVGLLAHPGIVDIRITAKAASEDTANTMISDLETIIRQRLGTDIYGVDDETLPQVIQKLTENGPYPIKVILGGFSADTFKGLEGKNLLVERVEPQNFTQFRNPAVRLTSPLFTCLYTPTPELSRIELNFSYPDLTDTMTREYMGAPGLREEWAVNFCLSFIRHQLISKVYPEEKNDPS